MSDSKITNVLYRRCFLLARSRVPICPTAINPCWYEQPKPKKGLNCLPYVYLAGVAKCGTTDLSR